MNDALRNVRACCDVLSFHISFLAIFWGHVATKKSCNPPKRDSD